MYIGVGQIKLSLKRVVTEWLVYDKYHAKLIQNYILFFLWESTLLLTCQSRCHSLPYTMYCFKLVLFWTAVYLTLSNNKSIIVCLSIIHNSFWCCVRENSILIFLIWRAAYICQKRRAEIYFWCEKVLLILDSVWRAENMFVISLK